MVRPLTPVEHARARPCHDISENILGLGIGDKRSWASAPAGLKPASACPQQRGETNGGRKRRREQSAWTLDRQRRRAEREAELGARLAYVNRFRDAPLFGVIHTDDLDATNLPAFKHCVLFLWAAPNELPQAFSAMQASGFGYRSCLVVLRPCAEDRGDLFRHKHALVLIGMKGHVPAPAPGTQCSSVIDAAEGRAAVSNLLERLFPNLPRLELFGPGEASCCAV